jgi:hypothetical protein
MGTEGGSEPADPEPTADAQPTTTSTQPIDETKPNAGWVFFAVMAVAVFLPVLTDVPRTTLGADVLLAVLGALMAGLAVVARRSWFRLYADRMEYSSLSGKARVMWFRDVEEAVLREAPFGGGPILKVRSRTGQKLSWDANPKKNDPGIVTERRLKAVYEALVAYGVEVDSQNYMRTGPFRMWRV